MIEAVHTNLQALPRQVLADTGYKAEAVFERLAGCGCDVVVALGREGKAQLAIEPEKMPHTAAMAEKLQTAAGRTAYARRKWLAEPPNGWIKHVLGFRRFSVRGLLKVRAEWKLVCLALNLRRMATMQGR
jgi:IS5 family transposase